MLRLIVAQAGRNPQERMHPMITEENIPDDKDACYEIVASQEEVYLEETEEEIRAILIFDDLSLSEDPVTGATNNPCAIKSVDEQVEQEVEELITGDSDDPPMSEDEVSEMIKKPAHDHL